MAEKDLETDKLELSLFRRKRSKGRSKDRAEEGAGEEAAGRGASAGDAATADTPRTKVPAAEAQTSEVSGSEAPASEGPASEAPASEAPTVETPAAPGVAPATPASPPRRAGGARVARKAPKKAKAARAPRTPKTPRPSLREQVRLPSLAPHVAALVVGGLVGLTAVVLTFASLQLCELVTGTDSCGGPGLVVLLAVVVLMILAGSTALTMFGVPESGGISFLGVAMFVAICLVVLLPSLLEPWMVAVAPVLCALTFAVALWIVTRFDEEILEQEGPEPHDVW
jgi:hypothetical protein